jgi:glycosyltransferase involved in cell wall biosynthesis
MTVESEHGQSKPPGMTQESFLPSPGRIVVIGPMLPFRGGISQYNGLLFESLKKLGFSSYAVSFSRQYPALLYPGKNDRDESHAGRAIADVVYSIDSLNPFSWWRTARRIANSDPELVVFHWWTIFWAPCFSFMCYLLRRKRRRIAFICHNLEDHDSGGLKAAISRRLLGMADGFLTHSQAQKSALAEMHPDKPVRFHPIPNYGHYPAPTGSLEKRGRLELLFFGFIRPYKGLDVLIEALGRLQDERVYLTVVGEPWGDVSEIQRAAAESGIKAEFHLEYKSDEEVADYFDRADFVVLPYRKATGSAVASVAHHYHKPLLASRVGGLPDVVVDGVTGILFPANDADALSQVIAHTSREQATAFSSEVEHYGRQWNWDSLSRSLKELARLSDTDRTTLEVARHG